KLIAFALDIARGMEYIHSQGVIHRNLKPENVLISEDFHLRIADFGIACEEAYCYNASVKVWLGDNADHYYVLSRFLLSRTLTVTKIKLLDLSLLSATEIDWLNNYHSQVWEK
ncbi:hypothetical protein S83_070144, partial [Arachis hypogaea]